MNRPCQNNQEKIADLAMGMLEISEQLDLLQHIEGCAGCKSYYEGLQAVDGQIQQWSGAQRMSDKAEKVIAKLNAMDLPQVHTAGQAAWRQWNWKKIAAIIIVAAGVIFNVIYYLDTQPGTENIITGDTNPIGPNNQTGPSHQTSAGDRQLLKEKQQAESFFNRGQIKPLELLLDAGLPETKILAAGYLAQIGDKSVIATLQKYSDKWPKDGTENPFQKAIEAIQQRHADIISQ